MSEKIEIDSYPSKKPKLDNDNNIIRTVGTQCGSWRIDEEDGGDIVVLASRLKQPSPVPTDPKDAVENIEDVWIEPDNNDEVCICRYILPLISF